MGEESVVHRLDAFRKPEAVKLPESFLMVAEVLGLSLPKGPPTHYRLRRRKQGAEVFVTFPNGLSVNLTILEQVTPADFKAARVWVEAWAGRHGFTIQETGRRSQDG